MNEYIAYEDVFPFYRHRVVAGFEVSIWCYVNSSHPVLRFNDYFRSYVYSGRSAFHEVRESVSTQLSVIDKDHTYNMVINHLLSTINYLEAVWKQYCEHKLGHPSV